VDGPYAKAYRRAIETGTQQHVRAFAEQLAGWLDVTAYPTASGLALYIRDVTIDELAHQESAATQRRLADQARLLDASRDAMVVRSLDHTIEYWNSAASTLYGWSVIEAYGRSARELLFDDKAAFDNATGALLRNGYWSGELEQRTHDGRTIIVESRWQLILDDHGAPSSVFAVSTDVTEERRTVDARLRTQRMESLGTLAGGIAHDLNNVLTPILMSIQLLQQREQDESARGLLSGMEGAVKRGADMINQVLSFARGVEGRRIHVSLADLLDGVAVFVRDTLPKNIGVTIDRVDVDDDVDVDEHTLGDPTQLMQVLINLVTNARDAMPNGGHLRIGATRVFVDDQYISATHEVTPGSYLSIEVEDDGDGMPPEVVAKVFEPFYTTKALGRGTGLGLSTSLAIVRSHGGFMQVYSEVGNGTKLQVALPVVPIGEADGDHPDRPEDQLPQGAGELILVIDDEPMILQVTAQTLTSYGYRVHTASNGRDAIDVAESAGEPIDLVLTDMMMPVMDGAATSAYFEDHYPQTPIVAMSGLSSYGTVSRTVGMGIARFLPKPFTTSQLLTAVHDTLHDSLHDTLHEGLHDRDADGDDAP
jgi:PAS domain S-box-containing protein